MLILMTSRGRDGLGVQPLPAPVGSKRLIQTHHVGTSVRKTPGEGERTAQLRECLILHVSPGILGRLPGANRRVPVGKIHFGIE